MTGTKKAAHKGGERYIIKSPSVGGTGLKDSGVLTGSVRCYPLWMNFES